MMLQKWFNLSDPMLEEMFCDRISFRRFVGLKMDQNVPDETTFVQFRKRLNAHGHIATLFDKTIAILNTRGVIAKTDGPRPVKVDIHEVNKITLCVNRSGKGSGGDDAVWVDVKVGKTNPSDAK